MTARSRWIVGLTLGGLLAGLPIVVQAETARWDIDPDHSLIEFRVAHMVVSKTAGRFMDYRGFVDMDADAKTFKTIEATINAASINTNHDKRDAHLRTADFLDVKQFPTMTYKMKRVQKQGDTYTVIGDFTLRGVTKEISLVVAFNGVVTDPWGGTRAGFSAEGTLNRKDFGIVWNKTLDSGGLVVGNDVQIRLEIECIKAKQP
jgi:polyisoprenoid-binding protein YceI